MADSVLLSSARLLPGDVVQVDQVRLDLVHRDTLMQCIVETVYLNETSGFGSSAIMKT